nr:cellulose synthase catalytic subunit [Pelagibacterium limicola]
MRQSVFRLLALAAVATGLWYLSWRWTASLNYEALWFALPLVLAETCAFIGLLLYYINLWKVSDPPITPPPATIAECVPDLHGPDRPLSVDVFFATYNEDPELVRLGIRDARAMRYPHPLNLVIHVLDDGRREEMRAVAEQEGVNYITRPDNAGYKAGNLRNGIEETDGDFILICDADTRPFPTLLERTMGYFRDPRVAWVQTPQWFFDLPEGIGLGEALGQALGRPGRTIGGAIERVFGPIRFGEDPFVSDPRLFYDVLLRRRNWANAAFCCGAASIHRREAVIEAALRSYGAAVERAMNLTTASISRAPGENAVSTGLLNAIRDEAAHAIEFTPYKFHVSEDIYTSIVLHSDRERDWRSIQHPYVESKMLSPQDLLSWTVQRFKYAGGTLDIFFHDNPLWRKGLSLPQKLMYGSTFWSYLGAIWNLVFLAAPVIYLLTGIAPVDGFTVELFNRLLPFLIAMELAAMVGTWGIPGNRGKSSYLSFFPINLQAIWTVVTGRPIAFKVTPKQRQQGRFYRLVWPQIAVMGLTLGAIAYALSLHLAGSDQYSLTGLVANIFWGFHNCMALAGIVYAAGWQPPASEAKT